MALVRVTLSDPNDEYDPFSLDLFVDPAGILDDRIVTYGRWGKLKSDDIWPLIVRPNAGKGDTRLDFGFDSDLPTTDEERFAWTNICSKQIAPGEFVSVRYDGDEICYRVTQVKELPSGEDFRPTAPA